MSYTANLDSGTPCSLYSATSGTSQHIPKQFTDMPVEIRDMIYAKMVNHARLLRNDWSRHESGVIVRTENILEKTWDIKHDRLPCSLFLNQEARKETLRHIILVPGAIENLAKFPWAYVNPGFDVLYFRHWDEGLVPAPGIQTLAILITSTWTKGNFIGDHQYERQLVDRFHQFPGQKEVLFVRGIGTLSNYKESNFENPTNHDRPPIPSIERHPCGFFGVVNNRTEHLLAALSPPRHAEGDIQPYQTTDEVVEKLASLLMDLNDEKYPGGNFPRISAVYDHWLDANGLWQEIGIWDC